MSTSSTEERAKQKDRLLVKLERALASESAWQAKERLIRETSRNLYRIEDNIAFRDKIAPVGKELGVSDAYIEQALHLIALRDERLAHPGAEPQRDNLRSKDGKILLGAQHWLGEDRRRAYRLACAFLTGYLDKLAGLPVDDRVAQVEGAEAGPPRPCALRAIAVPKE